MFERSLNVGWVLVYWPGDGEGTSDRSLTGELAVHERGDQGGLLGEGLGLQGLPGLGLQWLRGAGRHGFLHSVSAVPAVGCRSVRKRQGKIE